MRVEVGGGRTERRNGTQRQLHRIDLVHDAGVNVLAEVGVLIHRAEDLAAFRFGEILHARAHLIVVRGELAVFVRAQRQIHRPRAGQRKHTRHLLLDHHRQNRVHLWRATAADGEKDVVEIDQLVHRLHRLGDHVFHVLDDEADLAAVDAAFRVDVIERHADRIRGVGALHRRDAGQVGHHADDDLGI